ncbi:MAG: hypothetical protein GF317_07700 [Candidatus Lokiarchaeota archaeon]|nr:hypothetical protein [Candidatus Lokiarchaeota archaeon]MBD3199596.1 hypothetical protein [Candidatus Lokiarchaeota archaeon]
MTEFVINDKWILDRVSAESKTFSNWLNNLIDTVKKSVGDDNPEAIEKIEKEKNNLNSLKNLDQEISSAMNELDSLGFLGSRIRKWTSNILTDTITKVKESSNIAELGQLGDLDLDLNFILGKRKNLSSVLFDTTKERGIDLKGILYLIKSLPDLEAFLYSTSVQKYYRDHTEHALRVAVLGDFLLEQDFGNGTLDSIISDLTSIKKRDLRDKYWWVTGLLHDIGYPLGKMTTAVNYSLLNQLLKCYPTLDIQFSPLEIGLSWDGKMEEYLAILEHGLSKKARKFIKLGVSYLTEKLPNPSTQTFLKNKDGHKEFEFNDPINLDHGVISALCLLNSLGEPEEIQKNDEYFGYIHVARAIALHNFKTKLPEYNFKNSPLTFFLMLIDEIQEWGRPIPVQIRDTYFTTELKKISLLDEITLDFDDFFWYMQFKNQEAKKLMNFNFKIFANSKSEALKRIDHQDNFRETTVKLQDIIVDEKKKHKVIAEDIISI